jgi:hypothetical protein
VALPLPPPAQLIAAFLAQCPAAQVEEMRFPCEPKEYFAARCLRARKYSLVEALKLVEVTTTWRREINIKGLQAREAPEILGCLEDELQFFYQKSYFACRDNEGRPVYVERGGTVDVDAMFSECCSRPCVCESVCEATCLGSWPHPLLPPTHPTLFCAHQCTLTLRSS